MERYVLIGEYKIGEDKIYETCDNCGKSIKAAFLIKNNIDDITIKVCSVCIGEIMNLTEEFNKVLIKELKKYHKLFNDVNKFKSGKDEFNKMRELLITQDKSFLEKHSGIVWDENLKKYRVWKLEEFDNDKEWIIKMIEGVHKFNIEQLEVQRVKLNKLSKIGLIHI